MGCIYPGINVLSYKNEQQVTANVLLFFWSQEILTSHLTQKTLWCSFCQCWIPIIPLWSSERIRKMPTLQSVCGRSWPSLLGTSRLYARQALRVQTQIRIFSKANEMASSGPLTWTALSDVLTCASILEEGRFLTVICWDQCLIPLSLSLCHLYPPVFWKSVAFLRSSWREVVLGILSLVGWGYIYMIWSLLVYSSYKLSPSTHCVNTGLCCKSRGNTVIQTHPLAPKKQVWSVWSQKLLCRLFSVSSDTYNLKQKICFLNV